MDPASPRRASGSAVVLYADGERLDPGGALLGVPPLVDGAVLSLHSPDGRDEAAHPAHPAAIDPAGTAQLHVVGGPDAGGVHLLHGGQVRIGRSADADVPLDDPDVSRLHCSVTVGPDGRQVSVADLGSTNGTTLDGRPVGDRPVPLPPGALLRIGESTLRLEPPAPDAGSGRGALPVLPDTEGHLRIVPARGGTHDDLPRGGDHIPAPRGPEPEEQHTAPAAAASPTPDVPDHGPAPEGSRTATRDRLVPDGRDSAAPDDPAAQDRTHAGRTTAQGNGLPGAIGSWARRIAGGRRGGPDRGDGRLAAEAAALRERAPDPAAVLLTALGPGPRLWERGADHPDALTVRLGTADLPTDEGPLPAVPVTVDLREAGSLGLTGPRPRLSGLARAVIAQLCALHSPGSLEIVLISADRARPVEHRAEEWAWLNWLPHLRPSHGQDCRLLLALDRDQAQARTAELLRRLDGTGAAARPTGATLLVVDGDPGSSALAETVARLAHAGPAAGIHLLCLTESAGRPAAACGAVARLEGDVATALVLTPDGPPRATVDAVSAAWAERFARALAPLRETDGTGAVRRTRSALPETSRLLDELDLALATPSKVATRWATESAVLRAVLGTGPDGPVAVDLAVEGPHLLVGGASGAGKTELLRSAAAALAASARPDRLQMLLVDGAPERGEGLRVCTDLPQVTGHLAASDPLRMREFAQTLTTEVKRREELLAGTTFDGWHAERRLSEQFSAPAARSAADPQEDGTALAAQGALKVERRDAAPLPRLVVLVDDFDALTAPALGAAGRPAAGSVVRAVEAVARGGARLGMHLMVSTGRPERTSGTDADGLARLRIALRTEDLESAALLVHVEDPAGLDEQTPGRGYLRRPDGAVTPFQSARVSGRIPRTATLRPTVVPLEWDRMGDPPTRRPVRELGNGPTDLALLASALQRAAAELS